jgi:hypothetical protein
MTRHIALPGLLLFLIAGLASAADLTGTWKGSFNFQEQAVPLTLDLKGATAVTGTIAGMPSGTVEIKDGKLEGDTLTFWIMVEYQGMPVKLVYKGKVAGSEIKFAFGTEDGSWGTEFTAKKG